ncbi:hypothetical protein PWT90_08441 [Aphanocladium album]|nr:hypothetical protein PWT90_08441 [Aphanocladium album]
MIANVTDPITATGSILRVVTNGVQLATTLQTYRELAREAETELHDTVFEVNATAAALKQLHAIIDADRDRQDHPAAAVFKDDGIREVETLALKCHAIYNNIILLIWRARLAEGRSSSSTDKSENNDIAAAAAAAASTTAEGATTAALDPTTLRPLTLMGKLRWPWLRPRILRCREQLNWLKVSLLFTLQLASIAQWQMSGKHREESLQEMESRQQAARQLQDRRNLVLHTLAMKKAEGDDNDALQGHNSTTSDAGSACCVVASAPIQEAARDIPVAGLALAQNEESDSTGPDQVQNMEKPCAIAGTRDGTAETETNPTISRSFNTIQDRPEKLGAPRAPALMRLAIDSLTDPLAPYTVKRKSDSTANDVATQQISPVQIQPPPIPSANNRTGQTSVIIGQLPSYLNRWADRVFGSQKKYRYDKQSTSLEAYVAEDGGRGVPIKIPFGHERLSFGLEKVLKDWRGDQWTNYLAASPVTRLALDGVTEAARKASNHEKTCLAFKQYGLRDGLTPFLLVFYSLENAREPIILLVDGKRYSLPFAACQTLHEMEQRIRQVCLSSSADTSLLSLIETRSYELVDQSDNIILPSFLIESLKPGIELSLLPPPRPTQATAIVEDDSKSAASEATWQIGEYAESENQEETVCLEEILKNALPARRRALYSLRFFKTRDDNDLNTTFASIEHAHVPVRSSCGMYISEQPKAFLGNTSGASLSSVESPSDNESDWPSKGLPTKPLKESSAPDTVSDASRPRLLASSQAEFEDGEGLILDVLDVGLELSKGEMSIDRWLERMTNTANVTHGTDHA